MEMESENHIHFWYGNQQEKILPQQFDLLGLVQLSFCTTLESKTYPKFEAVDYHTYFGFVARETLNATFLPEHWSVHRNGAPNNETIVEYIWLFIVEHSWRFHRGLLHYIWVWEQVSYADICSRHTIGLCSLRECYSHTHTYTPTKCDTQDTFSTFLYNYYYLWSLSISYSLTRVLL